MHIANQMMMKCSQDLSVVSRVSRNHKQELELLLKRTTSLQRIAHLTSSTVCKNMTYDTGFVQHITHVYHLDMSLPKILVVNQFTIT